MFEKLLKYLTITKIKKASFLLIAITALPFLLYQYSINAQSIPSCQNFTGIDPFTSDGKDNKCNVYLNGLLDFNIITSAKNERNYDQRYIPDSSGISLPPCSTYQNVKKPRINCADPIDFPLCNSKESDILKNCIEECQYGDNSYYDNHNVKCVAFRDKIPDLNPNKNNYPLRKCHQLPTSDRKPGENCELVQCNLLTVGEISYFYKDCQGNQCGNIDLTTHVSNNISKFCSNMDKNFLYKTIICDKYIGNDNLYSSCKNSNAPSSPLQCFMFSKAQIDAGIYSKSHCQANYCNPSSPNIKWIDSFNIFSRGDNYTKSYYNISLKYNSTENDLALIKLGIIDKNKDLCQDNGSLSIIKIPYSCTLSSNQGEDDIPNVKFTECDTDCVGGQCFKTLDCNIVANQSNPLCKPQGLSNKNILGDDYFRDRHDGEIPLDSWLYRPAPLVPIYKDANNAVVRNGLGVTKNFKNYSNYADIRFECMDQDGNRKEPTEANCSLTDIPFVTILGESRIKDGINRCCPSGTKIQISEKDRRACYTRSSFESIDWNGGGNDDGDGSAGTFGYFYLIGNKTVSPEICENESKTNLNPGTYRGNGYIYLCGNDGLLYNKVSSDTAYIQGYPREIYEGNKRKFKITACLRFNSSFMPIQTCGRRSCKVSCGFGLCSEYCGEDVCVDLEVSEDNPSECIMNSSMAENNSDNKPCAKIIDDYLRLRIVKYGNKICSFFDVKGQLAYNDIFIDSSDRIPLDYEEKFTYCKDEIASGDTNKINACIARNEHCITGYNNGKGDCIDSIDGSYRKTLAHIWRPMLLVKFTEQFRSVTENGVENGVPGFYDANGKFHKAQNCANIPFLISPPPVHNLGNFDNSYRLFEPPLYISKVYNSGNWTALEDINNATSPETNFHNPKIEVTYGATKVNLELAPSIQEGVIVKNSKSTEDYYKILDQENKDCNDVKNFYAKNEYKTCETIGNDVKYNKYIFGTYNPYGSYNYNNNHGNINIDNIIKYSGQESGISSDSKITFFKDKGSSYDGDARWDKVELDNYGMFLKTITIAAINQQTTINRTSIFLKKTIKNNVPYLCLMKRIHNENNAEDVEVQCVKRKKEDVRLIVYGKSSDDIYKIPATNMISDLGGSIYGHKKIYFRYLMDEKDNVKYYSSEYSLNNINTNNSNCMPENSIITNATANLTGDVARAISADKYPICSKRDRCSELFNECIGNEIQIHRKSSINAALTDLIDNINKKAECQNLEKECRKNFGIDNNSTDESIYSLIENPSGLFKENPTYYGFFNEICLDNEEIKHLKQEISAYQINNNTGRCIVEDTVKCPLGGNGRDCPCLINSNIENTTKRLTTSREAGLCVDIKYPAICRKIDFNNSNLTDSEIVNSDKNKLIGDNINQSHKDRTSGNPFNDNSIITNGEFPYVVAGMEKVKGKCVGYWQNTTINGSSVAPLLSCIVDSKGAGKWIYPDGNINSIGATSSHNNCVRYACPAILIDKNYTSNPDISINSYGPIKLSPSNELIYDINSFVATNEQGVNNNEIKGRSNGFAVWPYIVKNNDYAIDIYANTCIPGYKPKNSSANFSYSNTIPDDNTSHFITGYTGGVMPNRLCNAIGEWGSTITDSCERISCKEIDNTSDNYELIQRKGAYFVGGSYLASKSRRFGNYYEGRCDNARGFYESGGNPGRYCDYLGNWGPVINPCATKCDAINAKDGESEVNGYAEWAEVRDLPIGTDVIVEAKKCIDGYIEYPYTWPRMFENCKISDNPSEAKCLYGYPTFKYSNLDPVYHYQQKFLASISSDSNNPYNVAGLIIGSGNLFSNVSNNVVNFNIEDEIELLSSRSQALKPIRACASINPNPTQSATVPNWTKSLSSCINKCPGSDYDPRIGIGRTKVDTSEGVHLINWPSAPFGATVVAYGNVKTYKYKANDSDPYETIPANHDANNIFGQYFYDYFKDRNNGFFVVYRKCGSNGRWENLEIACNSNIPSNQENTLPDSNSNFSNTNSNPYFDTTSQDIKYSPIYSNKYTLKDQEITGMCRENLGYFANNYPNDKIGPQYKCVIPQTTKNGLPIWQIDKSYYELSNNKPCKQGCLIEYNKFYGNTIRSSNNSTTINIMNSSNLSKLFIAQGSQTSPGVLSCKSGYGAPKRASIDQDNKTLFDDPSLSCGSQYQTIRDGTKKPIAKCAESGVVEIINDCQICLSCNTSSPQIGDTDGLKLRSNNDYYNGWFEYDPCATRKFVFNEYGDPPSSGGDSWTRCRYTGRTHSMCNAGNQCHYFGARLTRKCIDGVIDSKWSSFQGSCDGSLPDDEYDKDCPKRDRGVGEFI